MRVNWRSPVFLFFVFMLNSVLVLNVGSDHD